jgi:hypothetical protein
MIGEAVLALEYGASSEDIARTTHAHVRFLFHVVYCCAPLINLIVANAVRGIPRSRLASVRR